MADPVTLVILVAAGEAASPGASAMAQGARDAFAGAATAVRETRAAPTDADAMGVEEEAHPDAVAELIWRDADHRHATLRVHLRRSARWIERSFTFGPSDPATERGRTLGFAVAAILPEVAAGSGTGAPAPVNAPASASPTGTAGAPAAAPATAPGPPTAPASATPTASATAPAPATASGPAPAPATSSAPPSAPARASAAANATSGAEHASTTATSGAEHAEQAPLDEGRSPRIVVDLLGEAATGIGVSAPREGTEGGGAAIEWFVHRQVSVRLGAVVRAGSLDVAAAHTTTVVTSAGLVLQPWQTTRSQPFGVSLRADYILVRESATHDDSDDPIPVEAARWLSGVDTFFDGQLALSTQIAAVAGIGLEDVWAPTYISVRDVRVATLPALRAVAEAGFQLRF